jgi:RND family efflux transporter MFP subunit
MKKDISKIFQNFFIILLFLSGCSKQNDEIIKDNNEYTLVTITNATKKEHNLYENYYGRVINNIDPTIKAEVQSKVLKTFTSAGKLVKKGEKLFVFDASDFKIDRDKVVALKNKLVFALKNQENNVKKNKELLQSNFISQKLFDSSVLELNTLVEELKVANSDLKIIESKIKKCIVRAPFDGVLDSPLVSANDFVQVGTPLVKIISKISSSIHVPVNILNSDIYKIGTNVIFNFKQTKYDLVVNDIKPSLNSDNSLTLVVKLPKNVFIPAGKNVKIKIFKTKIINAIFIPEESIVQRPNGKVVYILNENIVSERKIITGVSSSLQTEIISGLEGDESIILEGAGFLTDGARVKVKIGNE